MTTLFDLGAPVPACAHRADAAPAHTVLGLDLSLNSSGISTGTSAEALIPKNLTGHARLEYHRRGVWDRTPDDTALVVMEGPAMSASYRPGVEEMTYLRGLVKHDMWRRGIPVAVCLPQHRIIYATGVANPAKHLPANRRKTASKRMVLAAVVEAYGVPCASPGRYDQADSTVLAAMGLDWLGYPLAALPETHRRALDNVTWPDTVPVVAR